MTLATKDPLVGGIAATAVAAAKELADRRSPDHTCSFQDFAVTAAAGWAAAWNCLAGAPKRDGVQVVYSRSF